MISSFHCKKQLQALAASGLRSLRYAREVDGLGKVVALDNDKGNGNFSKLASRVPCI